MLGLTDFLIIASCVWVLVNVLEVLVTCQLWHPWWLDPLLENNVPINTLEPSIILNVFSTSAKAAQSLGQVLVEQARDQLTTSHRHIGWELVAADGNLPINVVGVRIIKWRISKLKISEKI